MSLPMPKVVFEMVALVLEGVEGLILDFPACPPPTAQSVSVVALNCEVGDPSEVAGLITLDFPVFQEIDPQMGIRLVERYIIE